MDNLISRQAAIKEISHMLDTDGFRDGWAVRRESVKIILKGLPPAEPEHKKGKWIRDKNSKWGEAWLCSECGEKTTSSILGYPRYIWCPMCGTHMTGEQDDND